MTNEPHDRTQNQGGAPGEPAPPGDAPAEERAAIETGAPPEDASGTPPPPPPPAAPPRRRLTRSRRDEVIGGVAGGIAEYLDADPTLVRIAIVVLALLSAGTVVLLYIAAWIIMPQADPATEPAHADAEAPPVRRGGGGFAPIFWGLVLIAIGVLLLLWRLDVALPRWDALLAGLLIAVGLLIVIEARRGMHGGLFAVAIILTVVLGVSALVNFRVESGFGDRFVAVQTVDSLDREYGHAFGTMTLDLRNVDLPPGTTRVRTSIAFGELRVRVPADVGVRTTSTTLFGSTDVPDRQHAGFSVDADVRTPNYDTAERRIHIEVTTLFGSTRVEQ
jgi:phage shock protein C